MVALFFGHGTIDHWLATYGYIVVFVMVGVESLGIPVPGETTLIAASLYAGSTGNLRIWWVIAVAAAGAIVGDNVGFAIGRYGGAKLLLRYGEKIRLDERKLKVGVWIFRRHGGKVVFFGRFVSILRTYAAFLAGTNRMRWPAFLAFNAAGGVVWASIYGVAYYEFGSALRGLSTTIDIALGAVALAVLVAGFVWIRRTESRLEDRAERELEGSIEEELGEPEEAGAR
ncbi:MAG: DedA family protein [Gaiellaceae bacterium]